MKNTDVDDLMSEAFYSDLGKYTYGKVIEQNYENFDECFEYLKSLEVKIQVRGKEMNETSKKTYLDGHDRNSQQQMNNYGTKLCKLHRMCNHTTEECTKYDKDFYFKKEQDRVNENRIREERRNDDRKNYLITEKLKNPTRTAINELIKNKQMELIFDSGATRNFVSSKTVNNLNLPYSEVEPLTLIFGNGHSEKTNIIVELEIELEGLKKTIREEAYVLNNLPEDLLLGNEFLLNSAIVLDFKNHVVIIDNKVIKMNDSEDKYPDEMDRIIYERLLCINTRNTI